MAMQTQSCMLLYMAMLTQPCMLFQFLRVCRDYNDYFKTLPVTAKANENLFWSGTFSIVAEISKNNLGATVASSANADASVIINRMETKTGQTPYWCGTVRGGGEGV